ncbi:MAG TPA: mannitol dehydrogenase family protein [Alteraurantiacibacter sp.]
MRLSHATLDRIPPGIPRFAYNRNAQAIGIVHFGIGAFHRAHQAWYTDLAMDAGARGWAICGISLRSAGVKAQLAPQDGLYSLAMHGSEGNETRVIGAVREVLFAGEDTALIAERIASGECHIVSFTVTEKGYCRAADGSLDLALAEAGFYPLLAQGLTRRMKAGLPGVTLLSCDNLSGNGDVLARLVAEYIAAGAPETLDWFAAECTCPNSMIDRIVPASTEADLAGAEAALGLRDEGAVVTETFSQWVIEDRFSGPRPPWEDHGAEIVADVAPYETAKLRMLNGAHSTLAYCGLDRGHEFVHQAIAAPELRALAETLMRDEAATSFAPAPGQDLSAYADALIARFENPALNHRLAQIAMDGSQKVPQRWLETLAFHQAQGQSCPALLTALASWLRHIRGDARPVDDPKADELAALWQSAGQSGIARALFGEGGMFAAHWHASDAELQELNEKLGERM